VTWNLLSNAVKFSAPGQAVKLALECTDAEVHLTVSDAGAGIPAAFLPRIFEPFAQAETRRGQGGLGLGLAIVRHIVEQHGGRVAATSPGPGRGATFVVTLPRTASPVAAVVPADTRSDALTGVAVLLVDDDAQAIEPIAALLGAYGASVATAWSAPAARERLATQRFDVLVSDLGMPDEDGYALIASVRADGAAARVPAIALSAYARAEDRTRALAAGFNVHLAKPVEIDELVAAIRGLLGRWPGAGGGAQT
jgi:CheY-like chemotaxis protein